MRILLSAFACSPGLGSDQAVGWGWAVQLAREGHQVVVITRAVNRSRIEHELAQAPLPNLSFEYHDMPSLDTALKRISPRNHLYYYFWQWGAYRLAQRLHTRVRFDLAHHVTWVSIRQPSFMGGLGIPFIFGPAAGGDSAPYRLRSGYGFRAWLRDWFRDLANAAVKFDPLLKRTFDQASRIVVTSEDTRHLVPAKYQAKTTTRLGIAMTPLPDQCSETKADASPGAYRLLYVGRFLDLKGMHLGLAAFAQLLRDHPATRLTMVGSGPTEQNWRALADKLGVSQNVDWVPWMKQEALPALFRQHDVFLFPSLQDSGGLVVLEAMSLGLPVVSLNLGGPGAIVDNTCGMVVEARSSSKPAVIEGLAGALNALAVDRDLRQRLSQGALQRAEIFQWSRLAADVYAGFGS